MIATYVGLFVSVMCLSVLKCVVSRDKSARRSPVPIVQVSSEVLFGAGSIAPIYPIGCLILCLSFYIPFFQHLSGVLDYGWQIIRSDGKRGVVNCMAYGWRLRTIYIVY